jgi:hypothetical protein
MWICDEHPEYGRHWHYLALSGTLWECPHRWSPMPVTTSDRIPYRQVHLLALIRTKRRSFPVPYTLSLRRSNDGPVSREFGILTHRYALDQLYLLSLLSRHLAATDKRDKD